MEIGVWDVLFPRDGVSFPDLYDQHLDEITLAEQCGFDHYWLLEHHLSPTCPVPSPNLFLAAAAGRTSRIRLGNMVNVLPFRNPIILAEEIAMLDNLTRGRLDVGIGRGLKPTEFDAFGLSQQDSRAMFLEALDVMRGIWLEDEFSFSGKYFTADKKTPLTPPLVQQPHPPLYISAQSPDSLRWAAERDLPFGQIDSEIAESERDQAFYREIQTAQGFAPEKRLFLTREVYVAPTDAAARDEAFPYLTQYWNLWGRYTQFTNEGRMPDSYDVWRQRAPRLAALSFEELIDQGLAFVGSPETVAGQVRSLQERLDPMILVCVFQLSSLPHDRVTRSMRLFAEEVLPITGAKQTVTV